MYSKIDMNVSLHLVNNLIFSTVYLAWTCNFHQEALKEETTFNNCRGADKSLARPGRKHAAPVKIVMGREMD
jgi:hypothetical protein